MGYSEDYPFLCDGETVELIKKSKTLFFLRLPEPENESLVNSIIKVYEKDVSVVKPPSPDQKGESPPEAKKQCEDERGQHDQSLEVEKACKDGFKLVIIADPNLTRDNLEKYQRKSLPFFYTTILVNPSDHEEVKKIPYPLFYGWFVNEANSRELRELAEKIYEECLKNEKFSEEFTKSLIPDKEGQTPDPQKYFSSEDYVVGPIMLHCTAFYSNYGEVTKTKEYVSKEPVQKAIGKALRVEVMGLLVTPRSLGFRLKLNQEDLPLWDEDDGASVDPAEGGESAAISRTQDDQCIITAMSPTCGTGSRAHFSVKSGPGVQPVQTGEDLVQLIEDEQKAAREKMEDEQKAAREKTEDKHLTIQLDCGKARCYGKGNWMVYFDKPHEKEVLFSSFF
ncbi:2',3'-cyclic-nucleotide 3'-phosphodiesterase-like [Diadema antillarum]|uniref:2',3'-cyclic-nucleotide 3'-phosphodiesterase-like n=1 Tax=Diadema antillarum TaxID=105358 RepID=UPI003A8A6AA1